MKKLMSVLLVAVMAMSLAPVASAKVFLFGPKIGMNVNSLHFNKDVFDTDNRVGMNFGATAEVMLPVANIGFDFSIMYVRRNAKFMAEVAEVTGASTVESTNDKRDYFEIPINLKWKIPMPMVSSIVQPFIFTGPSFSFLTSKKQFSSFQQQFKNKSMDVAWNFGFGVELIKRVQVSASYGIGMSKALEMVNAAGQTVKIDGKNRYWTITAAYLFSL